jgi:hypothetical protein
VDFDPVPWSETEWRVGNGLLLNLAYLANDRIGRIERICHLSGFGVKPLCKGLLWRTGGRQKLAVQSHYLTVDGVASSLAAYR